MKLGRKGRRLALGLMVLIVAGIGAAVALQPSQGTLQASSPIVGKDSPSLAGQVIIGPSPSPSRLSGHYVVVNFFASWCSDCDLEAPQLAQFHAATSRQGVDMVMVDSFDSSESPARAFLARTKVDWTSVFDPSDVLALDWGVRAPPETFVVAPDGEVVAKFVGPLTAAQLQQVVP